MGQKGHPGDCPVFLAPVPGKEDYCTDPNDLCGLTLGQMAKPSQGIPRRKSLN